MSSSSKTADIKITYSKRVPELVIEQMRDTLGKNFLTTLYESKITVGTYNCNGQVSLFGVKDIFSYNSCGTEFPESRTCNAVFSWKKKLHLGLHAGPSGYPKMTSALRPAAYAQGIR